MTIRGMWAVHIYPDAKPLYHYTNGEIVKGCRKESISRMRLVIDELGEEALEDLVSGSKMKYALEHLKKYSLVTKA